MQPSILAISIISFDRTSPIGEEYPTGFDPLKHKGVKFGMADQIQKPGPTISTSYAWRRYIILAFLNYASYAIGQPHT